MGLTQTLLVEHYSGYNIYRNQKGSFYLLFLLLILILWHMAVLEEWRSLVYWWRVLLGEPEDDVVVYTSKHEDENDVVMSEISRCYKIVVILSNLLPRTVIAAGIMLMGARYLLLSESYEELMMNSLALTFLITIDE